MENSIIIHNPFTDNYLSFIDQYAKMEVMLFPIRLAFQCLLLGQNWQLEFVVSKDIDATPGQLAHVENVVCCSHQRFLVIRCDISEFFQMLFINKKLKNT